MTCPDVMPDRLDPGGLVQALELAELLAHREGYDQAGRASACGPAGPVQVVLVVVGRVEVDDELDAVHVNAARRDVGRDQDPRMAGRERVQRPLPLALVAVTVDGRGADARPAQAAWPAGRRRAWSGRRTAYGPGGSAISAATASLSSAVSTSTLCSAALPETTSGVTACRAGSVR